MLTPDKIQRVVADVYNVRVGMMRGPLKHQAISLPRQVAMYFCRETLCDISGKSIERPLSYAKIGRDFGSRDHSTVYGSCQRIKQLRDACSFEVRDELFDKIINRLFPLPSFPSPRSGGRYWAEAAAGWENIALRYAVMPHREISCVN